MTREIQHQCHARNCTAHCKPAWLMCSKHWRMVPKHLQREVWRHYVVGQCDLKPPPTEEWHKAADMAIKEVYHIEKQARDKADLEKAQEALRQASRSLYRYEVEQ